MRVKRIGIGENPSRQSRARGASRLGGFGGGSALALERELLEQLGGAFLSGTHPLRAQEELDDLLVTGLAAGARDVDQLFDQAGKFLAWDVVVGPAEIAVTMENFSDGLFDRLTLIPARACVLRQLDPPAACGATPLMFWSLLNCAVGAPAGDILGRVAKVGEDGVGMLAHLRRDRANRAWGLRELHRDADLFDRAAVGGRYFDDHVAGANLRVVFKLVEREHLADADVGLDQQVEPFVAGFSLEDRSEALAHRRPPGLVVLIGGELLDAERAAEVGVEPRLHRADRDDFAVASNVTAVVRRGAVHRGSPASGHAAAGVMGRERLDRK